MNRRLPTLFLGIALLALAATLVPPGQHRGFDLQTWGNLPVLADGRVKPLDTVARNSLLLLQNRQKVVTPAGIVLPPHGWLLDLLFQPAVADTYQILRIDHADVLSLFNLTSADGAGGVRFAFTQLRAGLPEIDRQAQLAADVEAPLRSLFQQAVIQLHQHLMLYDRLKFTLQAPDQPGFPAMLADAQALKTARTVFEAMDSFSLIRTVPPGADTKEWRTTGGALVAAANGTPIDPTVLTHEAMGRAWIAGDAANFNTLAQTTAARLTAQLPALTRKSTIEAWFNRAAPFYSSQLLYVVAFLCAIFSWLRWSDVLGRTAFYLMALAFALTTVGILVRMWLESRPPVTNLYSSALFVGWGAVGLCLILERLDRHAVAGAAGALIGFGTLVIAHHLSLSGDTLEMMRAVLDSNFWLATHVVTVTVGYSATFLAGFLATIYLVRGVFTRTLDRPTADGLARMVYGIVCFALFFSFIGTVLGGIWADQSWGRFWGWDPKENGALMIVIWNAVILHARWGGLIRQRGLMALSIFGNIVTAWSWFGTNMLGVGLHSYGFTNSAFLGLVSFVASQALLIALAAVPATRWRSRVEAV